MSNKDIIKSYEQICSSLKQNKNEEIKQQFLIIFKELELQLNKTFNQKIDQLSYTAKNLREEIRRIDVILSLIKNRKEFRNRMIQDHRKYIGYDPLELDTIELFDQVNDFETYKNNLVKANDLVVGLIRTGKKLKTLKSQLERNPKNSSYLNAEIAKLQALRVKQIEELKSNTEVMDDLYSYCLTAPFNKENAYIEYLMIKTNQKSELKINLISDNKRNVKSRDKKEVKVENKMPEIRQLGAVKPNNIFDTLNKAMESNKDINFPTNGLVQEEDIIKIDTNDL